MPGRQRGPKDAKPRTIGSRAGAPTAAQCAVVARRLTGAPVTEIALAWPSDSTDEIIEEFIGIVRGRTAASSRQPSAQQEKPKKEPKPDRRGPAVKKPKVAQRYAPNPDKGRGKGSRKKGKR